MNRRSLVGLLLALIACPADASGIKWEPGANMESQLFPALILATATQRPEDDENDSEADPEVLGDPYGSVGVSITPVKAGTKVEVTLLENAVMNRSSWSGVLKTAGTEYYVAPKVNYKFEQLRRVRQQVPLNVTFAVTAEGKSLGEQTHTMTLRTINDCPFGVSEAEETIENENAEEEEADDEQEPASEEATDEESDTSEGEEGADESNGEYTDMGWMFAAYVNENSPTVERVLKEALATKIVDSFAGYQKEPEGIVQELLAIWTALQNRGIKYSNITATAGESESVYSQHVRFVDESVANEQANCVDGSVLFASVLRKLGLRAFLAIVPGHMFMGVYLTPDGDERVAIETTLIGTRQDQEEAALKVVEGLSELRAKLDKKTAQSVGWKTFATALAVGTQNLEKHKEKFEAEDEPQYQIIDVNEARKDGIMPISYEKAE